MRLIILKDGIYNNEQNQAVECSKGDTLDTLPAYGQLLVDDGLADYAPEGEAETPVEPVEKSEMQKGTPTRGSRRTNAFSPK